MPQKKPKKPKHHQQHKPKKKKKPKHHGAHGKPNPDKARRKRGKKPQKPFHLKRRPRRSGSIPRACRRLIGEAKLLDCWLNQNPDVANAIVWQPAPGAFDTSTVAWPAWTAAMKGELRQAWMDARAWHENGMSHFGGPALPDPLPNLDPLPQGAPFRTLIDASQTWTLYLATVAHCLAAEIEGWVPWSLRGMGSEKLEHLLSGVKMFMRDDEGGYEVRGQDAMEWCLPSHPTYTYAFLVHNDLVANTGRATVGRMLEWCRANLTHFIGGMTAQNAENHWQYRGVPPARRIIEGTPLLNPANPGNVPAPSHWTAGCIGTSGFLRSLLRAVNVPVLLRWRGGHTMPYFATAGRYLSHGDDPYTAFARADYPGEKLLIDEETFDSWFPWDPAASVEQKAANEVLSNLHIGRQVYELAVWHFSDALMTDYCADKAAGASHAGGQVFENFASHGITLAHLESTHFWERLETEAQARGAC